MEHQKDSNHIPAAWEFTIQWGIQAQDAMAWRPTKRVLTIQSTMNSFADLIPSPLVILQKLRKYLKTAQEISSDLLYSPYLSFQHPVSPDSLVLRLRSLFSCISCSSILVADNSLSFSPGIPLGCQFKQLPFHNSGEFYTLPLTSPSSVTLPASNTWPPRP